jgi:hypothetical protein
MRQISTCFLLFLFLSGASAQQNNRPVATIPFESVENLIFLRVHLNGSGPFWFVLDSGASGCVIEKKFANKLGLKTEGAEQRQGAGAGKVDVTFTKDVIFAMPGLQRKVERTMIIDFAGLAQKLGHECAGLLGYEFFNSYVVSLDYDSRVVRFYEPGSFQYSGDGETLPVQIKKKLPYVRFKLSAPGIDLQETELLVDSGSADSVDSEIIAMSKGNKYEAIGGIGLGEPFHVTLGTYDAVQVGKLTLKNVHGASGASLIGGDFLHRFRVIFDYSRQQIHFEPNRHFDDKTLLNLSGIDLESTPDEKGFRVAGVLQGFAAEKAGFRTNDFIIAIDGQPSALFTWEQVIRLLHQDGQEYWFKIRRGEEEKVIHLSIPEKKI